MPYFPRCRRRIPINLPFSMGDHFRLAIRAVAEGYPDQVAVSILCRETGLVVERFMPCRGKSDLDRKLEGFNQAARGWYWLVLRNLDHDASCGAALVSKLLPQQSRFMQFRVAVRALESWLLGDAEALSRYLRVGRGRIPPDPEALDDPKGHMLRLAAMSSNIGIRRDMVPRRNSGGREGPGYAGRLAEFVQRHWRPDVAAERCDSLARCLRRLRELATGFDTTNNGT